MKKICLLIVSIFLFNALCFAEIKTFTKQGESVVQKDQSVNQVISYLKQKLTREAQEEAGTFITTNLKIDNYQITKDEFTSFAGSISKTTVLEETPFMKDKEQYVKVKIKADIDTDNVKAYLEKIMQDNEYKEQAQKAIKEAEELRKEKLELEEKLKTATKKQYEQELSTQVQQQVELQKQREIELNKMAIQAKEEFVKIKEEQNKKTQERENELLKLKEQIAQEKDNVKKAELENQAKIKELELRAKENQKSWSSNKNKISIQGAIEEATKVKQETDEIINKFETLLKENKDKITKSYDEQIQLSCNNSKKGQWETEEEYNARLDKNKQIIEKLEQEKEESLFEAEMKTIEFMVTTLNPFIEKLQYFQTENFYDRNGSKAELISIDKINVDNQFFTMNIKYNRKKYSLKYDFSNIGKEQAKLMCQTQNQFIIEPMFSVNDKLKQELIAFNVKHLGTKEEKILCISTKIKQFIETENFSQYNKIYNRLKEFNILNKKLNDIIKELKKDIKLNKYTKIIEKLEKVANINNYKKFKNFENFKNFIDDLKCLDNLIIQISSGYDDIIGLKKDGTVIVAGSSKKFDIDANLYNISKIAQQGHLIGITNNGRVISGETEDDSFMSKTINNITKWENIVDIIKDGWCIFGLKKDGTIITNKNEWHNGISGGYDEYNIELIDRIKTWKNIQSLYIENDCIIGIDKNGKLNTEFSLELNKKKYYQYLNQIKDVSSLSITTDGNAGDRFIGIKKDGTIFLLGFDKNNTSIINDKTKNLKFSMLSEDGTLGIKLDRTVMSIYGRTINEEEWKDIIYISANYVGAFGIKTDGSIIATGKYDISHWSIKIPEFKAKY